MTTCAVTTLLLLFTCVTCSVAAEGSEPLRYLIAPPVFAEVSARRGGAATLPCILRVRPKLYRVKWTKLRPGGAGPEDVVMVSNAHASKPYGHLGSRASLRRAHSMDASLRLDRLQLDDGGDFRCQLINGIEDESVVVTLTIEGVVFPYQSVKGRYQLSFSEAQEACGGQDATLATDKQLYRAWTEGLDWCNAGWLEDGTVRYPIIHPRPVCGGGELLSGIRSYGAKDQNHDRFDAFCFTAPTDGSVFFVPGSFSFLQAARACQHQGAELALVGHLYSAWRFRQYDQCDGGWLRDGSVRFPISAPRERCGGVAEAGVRSFGFPDQSEHLYGAYCFR